ETRGGIQFCAQDEPRAAGGGGSEQTCDGSSEGTCDRVQLADAGGAGGRCAGERGRVLSAGDGVQGARECAPGGTALPPGAVPRPGISAGAGTAAGAVACASECAAAAGAACAH